MFKLPMLGTQHVTGISNRGARAEDPVIVRKSTNGWWVKNDELDIQ